MDASLPQELDLLDDIRKYLKGRVALEMQYADGMQKLSATFLSHKIADVPDIQTAESEQVRLPKTTMKGYHWVAFFIVIVNVIRTPR